MNLDAALRLVGVVWLSLLAIKAIVWVVEQSARRVLGKGIHRGPSPWADGDVDDAAEFGIDLTRVADDPHTGGAR